MRNRFQSQSSLYSAGGQRKYLTGTERQRFIIAALRCPRRELRSFCLMLAYAGCRVSEALSVTPQSIALVDCFVAIRTLKQRNGAIVVREIPLPRSFVLMLKRTHKAAFRSPSQKLWPWSRSRAWQLVKAVMREAKISNGVHATPKGLRHAFGVHAIRCMVPLTFVQRWMGHARLETTAIYLQAVGDEEREIASRMWDA